MDGIMINCSECKQFNDAVMMKQCLAGKYQVNIAGHVMMMLGTVECDRFEPLFVPASVQLDKRTKEYKLANA
jgi:hypothetical protein